MGWGGSAILCHSEQRHGWEVVVGFKACTWCSGGWRVDEEVEAEGERGDSEEEAQGRFA